MLNKKFILLGLVAVVLVSACTADPETTQETGTTTTPPTTLQAPATETTLQESASADLLKKININGRVEAVVWSKDGSKIFSIKDGRIIELDSATGKILKTSEDFGREFLQLSPDGKKLATLTSKGINIFDAATLKISKNFETDDELRTAFWSPDGTKIASSGKSITIWDASTGTELKKLDPKKDYGDIAIGWSPDSKKIASAYEDNKVRIWDIASGEGVKDFLTGSTTIGASLQLSSIVWSLDGKKILASDGGKIHILDPDSGSIVGKLETKYVFAGPEIVLSPDGRKMALTDNNNNVYIADSLTGAELKSFAGHTDRITSVAWSPDGKKVASGSEDKTISVWKIPVLVSVEKFLEIKAVDTPYGTGTAGLISWSPDGKKIFEPTAANVWDASTGKKLTAGNKNYLYSSAVSAWSLDGKAIAASVDSKDVLIIDSSTGAEHAKLSGHTDIVYSLSWSPDSKKVVSGSLDKTIRIWDASSKSELRKMEGHTDFVRSVSWSPDGSKIASGSNDKTVRVWDANSKAELKKLTGHSDSVSAVAWSPDGKRIVSESEDDTIRIWDSSSGTLVKKISKTYSFRSGLSISPDGKYIATGGEIFDIESGKNANKIPGTARYVAWSPDGNFIAASGSEDGLITIWKVYK